MNVGYFTAVPISINFSLSLNNVHNFLMDSSWGIRDNTGPDWGPYSGIQVDEVTVYLETSPSVLMILRYAFHV